MADEENPPGDVELHPSREMRMADAPAPLAAFHGEKPPAPAWFDAVVAQEPERSFVEVEGAKVELLTWGKVGKPGLLLLHGNGAHADWWSFIAPYFADDWRVAAISWSGMGGSDWRPHYSGTQFVEEILAAADAAGFAEGGEKPLVVAHSFGGFIALLAAATVGEKLRAVVTVDSPIRPPHRQWRGPPSRGGANRVYATEVEALARFRLAPPQGCENLYIADFIARRSLKEVAKEDGGPGFTWKFDPFIWREFDMDVTQPTLPIAKCPVALMWGDRSNLVDPEIRDYMASQAPPGTPLVGIPDADHHVMIDQPLAFVGALKGLLAGWKV